MRIIITFSNLFQGNNQVHNENQGQCLQADKLCYILLLRYVQKYGLLQTEQRKSGRRTDQIPQKR